MGEADHQHRELDDDLAGQLRAQRAGEVHLVVAWLVGLYKKQRQQDGTLFTAQ